MSDFEINTLKKTNFIDITDEVINSINSCFKKCDLNDLNDKDTSLKSGLCLIYTPHTTAGIIINENADSDVVSDIQNFLKGIIPAGIKFNHAEGNSDAHIKSSIIGNSRIVPVLNGKLLLGRWEGIFLCEFDGPRTRKVIIAAIS
ncbi:MAG: YjbQ family protein [Candidatus Acididesulfobacter diazotrophicus]|uniref:YjbQ family protein n=1 Tax=Candidatus Acididesulfobacter diazotrophicus TaxID=2597226 RepID=A0A519BPD7_9DELT|nr:MAG: YjbQ family protein [Candidatus Acididesulfobacter diazotrophicus]